MTCAPLKAGSTCAFHKRWFSRVSLSVGGVPRSAAKDEAVEEDAIDREGGRSDFWIAGFFVSSDFGSLIVLVVYFRGISVEEVGLIPC
jgi:hypothetical protein